MKTIFFYCISSIIFISFAACKKNDANPSGTCKISSVHRSDGTVYNLTYDAQGRISELTYGLNAVTYNYTATGYVQELRANNTLKQVTTTELNAQGCIIKRTEHTLDITGNITGTNQNVYEYNANGEILKQVYNGGIQTTTYTWSNGNLASASLGSTYAYHTDKPAQDADPFRLIELLVYGRPLTKNKNLLKSISSGASTTTNYISEFDDKGRVIKFTVSLSSPLVYEIQYECR